LTQYALRIDGERCVGCHACEIACKQENQIPPGNPSWIQVFQVGPDQVGDKLITNYVPTVCRHCRKPQCMEACPVEAITKREDGIVQINADLCIGCKACIEACPFKAPQYNAEKNLVGICTLCVHRVEKGLKPSCAMHCQARAIYFGDPVELDKLLGKEHTANRFKST